MKLKSLKISNWKQFDTIDIKFHDRLTVLTGANASGKTTLLNLLARHFGWKFPELSTPVRDQQTGKIRFSRPISRTSPRSVGSDEIGEITYTNGRKTSIIVPSKALVTYDLDLPSPATIGGFYIPSDRPEFVYRPVARIPAKGRRREDAFHLVTHSHKTRSVRSEGGSIDIPNYYIKEALIGWGIYGFGSEVIVPNQDYKDMYRGFENVLRDILPEDLGFEKFSIRESELVLITESGEFMFDAVSGGIGALIDLSWQIYTFSDNGAAPFVVLIDEVETHLHAGMQRRVLPSLLKVFPGVQFIVSTHSPLIVGSVRDSGVYVLKFNDEHRVESIQLDITNKARDAVSILKDVLGVSFTMPVWAEEKLNEINEKYSRLEIDEATFASLREELAEIGLEDLVPYSIDKILSSKEKA